MLDSIDYNVKFYALKTRIQQFILYVGMKHSIWLQKYQ